MYCSCRVFQCRVRLIVRFAKTTVAVKLISDSLFVKSLIQSEVRSEILHLAICIFSFHCCSIFIGSDLIPRNETRAPESATRTPVSGSRARSSAFWNPDWNLKTDHKKLCLRERRVASNENKWQSDFGQFRDQCFLSLHWSQSRCHVPFVYFGQSTSFHNQKLDVSWPHSWEKMCLVWCTWWHCVSGVRQFWQESISAKKMQKWRKKWEVKKTFVWKKKKNAEKESCSKLWAVLRNNAWGGWGRGKVHRETKMTSCPLRQKQKGPAPAAVISWRQRACASERKSLVLSQNQNAWTSGGRNDILAKFPWIQSSPFYTNFLLLPSDEVAQPREESVSIAV